MFSWQGLSKQSLATINQGKGSKETTLFKKNNSIANYSIKLKILRNHFLIFKTKDWAVFMYLGICVYLHRHTCMQQQLMKTEAINSRERKGAWEGLGKGKGVGETV